MQCPYCESTEIRKNGKRRGKQNHICVNCGRQFIDVYNSPKGYSDDIKKECLRLYVNGMGFRAIERSTGVHHTTIIYWLKQIGLQLPDAPPINEIPEVGELDGLARISHKNIKNGVNKLRECNYHKASSRLFV